MINASDMFHDHSQLHAQFDELELLFVSLDFSDLLVVPLCTQNIERIDELHAANWQDFHAL